MKIQFIPHRNPATQHFLEPVPSVSNLPDWYKQKKPTPNAEKPNYFPNGSSNISIKWCNPFGDALQAGYQILLSQDLFVTTNDGEKNFVWHSGGDGFISMHGKEQISKELIPDGFNSQPFKFENYFEINTPKGHSSLFVHPINRPELPFHTLAGIVETDEYNLPVNLPFLIRDDFEGIIPAGTPLVQIIPFRRESWEAKIGSFNAERTAKNNSQLKSRLSRAYKTMFWQKKEWR
jgi:hypothetical protein